MEHDPIRIIEAVDYKVKRVRTKSLDISFNELLDMYITGELIINPEYQRLFRWSVAKQSMFIESLILELPIPPIFVLESEEGVYELIDGLQRVSSYLHFRGVATKPVSSTELFNGFTLEGCDIVNELNGLKYEDLPNPLKIKLKRNFIRVEVLRKESDSRLRYYMFKRLNTGGEHLSDQEIRNCTIRLISPDFINFIGELSQDENYKKCIENITDEKLDQKWDQELVLRFIALKNNRDNYKKDVSIFLDAYMESVSDPNVDVSFNYQLERETFQRTFEILAKTLGEDSFTRVNNRDNLVATLSPLHFEAFTLGIQDYLDRFQLENDEELNKLRQIFMDIKRDEEFKAITTGGGKNTFNELTKRISFVANKVAQIL